MLQLEALVWETRVRQRAYRQEISHARHAIQRPVRLHISWNACYDSVSTTCSTWLLPKMRQRYFVFKTKEEIFFRRGCRQAIYSRLFLNAQSSGDWTLSDTIVSFPCYQTDMQSSSSTTFGSLLHRHSLFKGLKKKKRKDFPMRIANCLLLPKRRKPKKASFYFVNASKVATVNRAIEVNRTV